MAAPRIRKPHVYRVEQWLGGAGGASGTHHVTIHGYAKGNSANAPYCVANEFICSRLGHVLSLPIPPGAIVEGQTPGSKAWMTLSFSPVPLPPVDPVAVVQAFGDIATELVVFDILVANSDRHRGNLAMLRGPARLEIYDHSHALLGTSAGNGIDHIRSQATELGVGGHCLLPAITDPLAFGRAIDTVRTTISEADLRRVCKEAGMLDVGITPAEARELATILEKRKQDLGDLVMANQGAFVGIPPGAWPVVI